MVILQEFLCRIMWNIEEYLISLRISVRDYNNKSVNKN